uniref:Putative NRPS condensation domain protein n=1 Tax=Amycolatopsis sp. SANK 60206 TaxID=1642649 RepID=A0A0E3Z7J1_9PSEU|nr:putative NRPS condensation domain protein [Amycolatopsis sp. SANK 60206]
MPTSTVAVTGCRSGEAPVTWGQGGILRILRMLRERTDNANISVWRPLPEGTDIAAALAWIRRLVAGYDVLRTRYLDRPEGIVQVVDGAGEIDVEMIDLGARDGTDTAVEVMFRLRNVHYPLDGPWAYRFALLYRDGLACQIVFACSHGLTDGWGMFGAFRGVLGRPDLEFDPGVQPLDQVAYETSDAGRAQSARARRYWHAQLSVIPAMTFPGPPRSPHEGIRFWYAQFDSPIITTLLPDLAQHHGHTDSTVLYAAFCAAIARAAGVDSCPLGFVSVNRMRRGTQQAIGPYSQLVPIVLPVAGQDPRELIRSAGNAVLSALRHGAYDPAIRDEVMAEVAAERGVEPDLSMWFNDTRVDKIIRPREPLLAVVHERGIPQWIDRTDRGDSTVFVQVVGKPDRMGITVMFDTTRLSIDDAEGLLAGVENWILEAAAAARQPAAAHPAGGNQ